MVFYSRVFCLSQLVPSIQIVIDAVNSESNVKLKIDEASLEEYSNGGKVFEVKYSSHKQSILVDINPVDVTDPVGKEEIKEFINDIGFAGFSSAKRKVINHLEKTNFIVACQLPDDLDNEGEEANQSFLNYYVENCEGLLHVDGEGFYDKDMTILLADK